MQDGDLLETQLVDGPRRHAALLVVARRGTEEMLEAFFGQADGRGTVGYLG